MTKNQRGSAPFQPPPPAAVQKFQQALSAHRAGRLDDAESLYSQIIDAHGDQFPALMMLGMLAAERGDFVKSESLLRKALALNPNDAGVLFNYGNVLLRLQEADKAFDIFGKVLALNPSIAEAHLNRGNIWMQKRSFEKAIACFDAALAVKPHFSEALCNRGNAFQELKQFDQALSSYDAALALNAKNAEFHGNRANALYNLKRYEEALGSLSTALSLQPGNAGFHYNRANILFELKRFAAAESAYASALTLEPDLEFAASARLQAKLHLHDWRNFESERAQLTSLIQKGVLVQPFGLLAVSGSPQELLEAARNLGGAKFPPRSTQWNQEKYDHDRIRVAYLSADFGEHAVSKLLAGVIEQHDRARIDVTGFSFEDHPSAEMQARLKSAFDRYEDVSGRSDEDVAQMMRSLEIDIAVDLMGYTRGARTSIFCGRPSPLQVNYLGFPGTMGAPYMDYIIADKFVIPESCQKFYDEKIVYLPEVFQANDFKRKVDDLSISRSEHGLPEHEFVFCSFNNSYKINPACFDVWMRLMSNIEGSVLWILGGESQENSLRREAVKRGIDARRLVFCSRTSYSKYLARYRLADLFLDTFPFNAGTTASDALFAGLPLITCSGQTYASRMAGALLHSLGLPELAVESWGDYEALAFKLASDRTYLENVRRKLDRNRAVYPLFDTVRFTRHLEKAYSGMVERRRNGLSPETFYVEPID